MDTTGLVAQQCLTHISSPFPTGPVTYMIITWSSMSTFVLLDIHSRSICLNQYAMILIICTVKFAFKSTISACNLAPALRVHYHSGHGTISDDLAVPKVHNLAPIASAADASTIASRKPPVVKAACMVAVSFRC